MFLAVVAALGGHSLVADPALATELIGAQPASLDQPRINVVLRRTPQGTPLEFDDFYNVQAFYDTGASGLLLSDQTAGLLGVQKSTFNGEPVIFEDVGVGGSEPFHVSEPLYMGLAKFHPDFDANDYPLSGYDHNLGPVRMQIGEPPDNPLLEGLDVIGMPAMRGKVVVMDPTPVDTFADTMRTYVYNPGTPFNTAAADSDPGIPAVERHVRLSYADVSRFTRVTPQGAPGPTLAENPFIGPNPVLKLDPNPPPDDTPPIVISYNGKSAEGSWLLDTGAAASILSKAQASQLDVRYDPATENTDNPLLLGVPQSEQFQLSIGGVGGTRKLAGFWLSSLLLPTEEGNASDPNDPNHIRFIDAPVLVGDITVQDPNTQQTLTLDGIFGMNFLVASIFISEGFPPVFGEPTEGFFDWLVFDEPAGRLGLSLKGEDPPPQTLVWTGIFNADWDTTTLNWAQDQSATRYREGNHVVFDDTGRQDVVNIMDFVVPGSITVDNSELDYEFRGGSIFGPTGLTKRGTGTLTLSNENVFTGTTDVEAGTIVFAASQEIGDVIVRGGASAVIRTAQRFEALDVAGGSVSVAPGSEALLSVSDLHVSGNGRVDLADNDMVVRATRAERSAVLARVEDLVGQARNAAAGRWTGNGLTSSSAAANPLTGLAVALNDDGSGNRLFTTFDGEDVDENAVLVKYTYNGDANLDGRINADDYFRIDQGFLSQPANPTYRQGDFNYDDRINADDYFLIDAAFLGQGQPLGGASGALTSAVVPEPGIGLMLVGAGMLLKRRRRVRALNFNIRILRE
jgi:autotransporter-associated beta strand protein